MMLTVSLKLVKLEPRSAIAKVHFNMDYQRLLITQCTEPLQGTMRCNVLSIIN